MDPQEQSPIITMPIPSDFDIRNLPRTPAPRVVTEEENNERYRVESRSIPCEERETIRNLLIDHLGEGDRREINRVLRQCRAGNRLEMDIFNDGTTDVGPSGLTKMRYRHRF